MQSAGVICARTLNMNLQEIITPERTRCRGLSATKKSTLELTSKILADQNTQLSYHEILTKLLERERLGSTSIGYGVAIPHARMHALKAPVASLLHLNTPIDFDNATDQPVDLIFGFIVPEERVEEHLHLISTLATLFSEETFRDSLRKAETDQELYAILVGL